MAYNNERARDGILWLDIETVARPGAVLVLGPIKPNRGIKDPDKIAADLEKRTLARTELAATDIDINQIVCISVGTSLEDRQVWSGRQHDEQTILGSAWAVVREFLGRSSMHRIGGFCNLTFDLPTMLRRSQMLGVAYPRLQMGKWRHDGIIDLAQVITFDGLVDLKGLDTYCRLFGIETEPDEIAGAQIGAAVADGRWDQVERHCLADVGRCILLAERIGVR